jgi:multidrug transporter EmrE-like cation transporter
MRNLRAYSILTGLVAFVAYFGVYGFYTMTVESLGEGWAFLYAVFIALGTIIIAAVGVTIVRSRVSDMEQGTEE